ncbi:MAG: PDZ domain-containing protein [Gemmatimonadales bacterium]
MKRHWLLATLGVALCIPAGLAAQRGRVQVFSTNRARLGVSVDLRADAEKDRIGARILSVLPDGPAAKAGLKAGDIITRFNSTALGGVKAEDEDVSGPGEKLVDLARELDRGDTVRIAYQRDGKNATATVVADRTGPAVAYMTPMPGGEREWNFRMPEMQFDDMRVPMPDMPFFSGPGGFMRMMGGLNLVDMDKDLGEYFGTSEGVLVLRTPPDSGIPLRAGDVILSIDGRKVQDAGHAQRILGSYEAGETIKAQVMRKQRRMDLSWKADDMRHGGMYRFQVGPEPDVRFPAPPAAPRRPGGQRT